MSTIKFEKGKFYKTRGGKKVECLHTSISGTEPLLFADDGGEYFTAYRGGEYFSDEDSNFDIISEWHEERVVWVVCAGKTRAPIVLDTYPAAENLYNCCGNIPTRSLTRVVIQDGHVDTE